MAEPVSLGLAAAAKAGMTLAPMTLKAVAQEWARRKADQADLDPASLASEMDGALDVLVAKGDTAFKAIVNAAKALASGVPEVFAAPAVRDWLNQAPVRTAVKSAAVAVLARPEAPQALDDALIAGAIDDTLRPALVVAFDYAVAFLARTVIAKLTPGERLLMGRLEDLQDGVDRLQDLVMPRASAALSQTLLDQQAKDTVDRLRRRRLYPECRLDEAARQLADRLRDGDLSGAAAPIRAEGLARCARWLALGEDFDMARALVTDARRLDAGEAATIAEAFIVAQALSVAKAEPTAQRVAGLKALEPIDTPAKRGAAMAIIGNAQDAAAVLGWVDAAEIDLPALDPEGRGTLLVYAVHSQDWDRAEALAERLSAEDFAASPRTLFLAALAYMAGALAPDIRAEVLFSDPPLSAAELPFYDAPEALWRRAKAQALFEEAAMAAAALDCPEASRGSRAFALWLGLRDPDRRETALAALNALLRDADQAIAFLPLALAFAIPVDRARIDQELKRREALAPGGDVARAVARFALANTEPTAADSLAYLRRHRAEMEDHILPEILVSFEVQLLVRLGEDAEAQSHLDAAEDLSPEHRARLQGEIGLGDSGPSVESLEGWYAAKPTVLNLRALVVRLSTNGFSNRWFDLARQLVRESGALEDAEAVVDYLSRLGRTTETATVLAEVDALVPASPALRAALAWSRYRHGDLTGADALLQALRQERDDHDDRSLLVNILISAGRWAELPPFLEQQWLLRDARTPDELLDLARLANQIGSQRAAEFAKLAADRAPANAEVLVAAYNASLEAGVETGDTVAWISRAHALSDESGPVTSASLKAILDQSEDWNRHTDDIWRKMKAAQIPLSLAATALRHASLQFQLPPMLLNPDEDDPRRRDVVPAFSGVREPFVPQISSLALDGSAIITLSVLGLLDTVLAKPLPKVMPQATLNWLLHERHRMHFHQPSRIRRAEALVRDLVAKRLHVFAPSVLPPPDLIDTVGRDLADMISAAQDYPGPEPRLVVRPGPVHKIGSLLDEEADLTAHYSVLASCARVIDKLAEVSVVTAEEAASAYAYLAAQKEARWPQEPDIPDGATLLLDDVSVSYLRTVGVLDRLHRAGLRAEISEARVEEANALIQLEQHAGQIDGQIEAIRGSLAKALATGDLKLGHEVAARNELGHPNVAVIKLAAQVDVVVSDERFLNKNRTIAEGGASAAVWCTLDIIDWLRAEGDIDLGRFVALRTRLRRAGAIFIPPTAEELAALVAAAPVKNGGLRETLDMRAFRENLLMAQMRGWLHLPDEAAFLQRLHAAQVGAIFAQWGEGADPEGAGLRSDWLLNVIDQRNWAQGQPGEEPSVLARFGHVALINRLFLGGPSHAVRAAQGLDAWLEAQVVEPLRHSDPEAYAWVMTSLRQLILRTEAVGDDDEV